jgi:hypothetical protein
MYDFGPDGNERHYNQTTAPLYHLADLAVNTIIYYGAFDTVHFLYHYR